MRKDGNGSVGWRLAAGAEAGAAPPSPTQACSPVPAATHVPSSAPLSQGDSTRAAAAAVGRRAALSSSPNSSPLLPSSASCPCTWLAARPNPSSPPRASLSAPSPALRPPPPWASGVMVHRRRHLTADVRGWQARLAYSIGRVGSTARRLRGSGGGTAATAAASTAAVGATVDGGGDDGPALPPAVTVRGRGGGGSASGSHHQGGSGGGAGVERGEYAPVPPLRSLLSSGASAGGGVAAPGAGGDGGGAAAPVNARPVSMVLPRPNGGGTAAPTSAAPATVAARGGPRRPDGEPAVAALAGRPAGGSELEQLPAELVVEILSHLSTAADIAAAAATCVTLAVAAAPLLHRTYQCSACDAPLFSPPATIPWLTLPFAHCLPDLPASGSLAVGMTIEKPVAATIPYFFPQGGVVGGAHAVARLVATEGVFFETVECTNCRLCVGYRLRRQEPLLPLGIPHARGISGGSAIDRAGSGATAGQAGSDVHGGAFLPASVPPFGVESPFPGPPSGSSSTDEGLPPVVSPTSVLGADAGSGGGSGSPLGSAGGAAKAGAARHTSAPPLSPPAPSAGTAMALLDRVFVRRGFLSLVDGLNRRFGGDDAQRQLEPDVAACHLVCGACGWRLAHLRKLVFEVSCVIRSRVAAISFFGATEPPARRDRWRPPPMAPAVPGMSGAGDGSAEGGGGSDGGGGLEGGDCASGGPGDAEWDRLRAEDAAADGRCPSVVPGEDTAILLGTVWMNVRDSHCGRCGSLVGVTFSMYRGGDALWLQQYLSSRWAAFSKRTRRELLPGAAAAAARGAASGVALVNE